jgi:hypothetical protein
MGPAKNVAKLPAKEFSVYFEISNVKSSLLHKKKSKSPKQNILIGCGVCVPGRQS